MCLIVNLLIQNEISIFEIHRFSWKCITVLHNESDLTTLALLATDPELCFELSAY